jgi:predicted PurR-regulated permease PerM
MPGVDRVRSVGALTYTTGGRSAAAKGFSALLQDSVVMVIALAFGVPVAPLLGAIATIASFIPQIGSVR